jgi:transcription antitermination factor NusG
MANKVEQSTWQDHMNEAYDLWKDSENKDIATYEDMVTKTSRLHQIAVLLGTLNYQVCNGGFSQWVENGYAIQINHVIDALTEVGTPLALQVIEMISPLILYVDVTAENKGMIGNYWLDEGYEWVSEWVEEEVYDEATDEYVRDGYYEDVQEFVESEGRILAEQLDNKFYEINEAFEKEVSDWFNTNIEPVVEPETEKIMANEVKQTFKVGDRVRVNSGIVLNQEEGTVQYVDRPAPFEIAVQLDNRMQGRLDIFSQDELEMIEECIQVEPDILDQPTSEPETEPVESKFASGDRVKVNSRILLNQELGTVQYVKRTAPFGIAIQLDNRIRGKLNVFSLDELEMIEPDILDQPTSEPEAEEIVIQYVVQSITEHRNYWIDSSIENSLSEAQETIRWYRENNRLNRRYQLIERTITTLDKVLPDHLEAQP